MYAMYAEVVKLVDTYVSGAYVAIHGGSSPLLSNYLFNFIESCIHILIMNIILSTEFEQLSF